MKPQLLSVATALSHPAKFVLSLSARSTLPPERGVVAVIAADDVDQLMRDDVLHDRELCLDDPPVQPNFA